MIYHWHCEYVWIYGSLSTVQSENANCKKWEFILASVTINRHTIENQLILWRWSDTNPPMAVIIMVFNKAAKNQNILNLHSKLWCKAKAVSASSVSLSQPGFNHHFGPPHTKIIETLENFWILQKTAKAKYPTSAFWMEV